MLTEPNRCNFCDAPDPDGDADATLCRACVQELAASDADAAREAGEQQRVDEHLDREREKRHGVE
jgi:hypothetical protein